MSRSPSPPESFDGETAGRERPIVEDLELAEAILAILREPAALRLPAQSEGSCDHRESCEPWPPTSPILSSLVRRLERRLGCDRAATESINAVLTGIRRAVEQANLVGSPEARTKRPRTAALDAFTARDHATDVTAAADASLARAAKPQSARGEGGRLKEKTQ